MSFPNFKFLHVERIEKLLGFKFTTLIASFIPELVEYTLKNTIIVLRLLLKVQSPRFFNFRARLVQTTH